MLEQRVLIVVLEDDDRTDLSINWFLLGSSRGLCAAMPGCQAWQTADATWVLLRAAPLHTCK
jgi:hypothetical protein